MHQRWGVALMGVWVVIGLGAGSAFALEKVNEADLQTARGSTEVTQHNHECVLALCRTAPADPQCYYDPKRKMCVKEYALEVYYCDPFDGRKCIKNYDPIAGFKCCIAVVKYWREINPPCQCNTPWWERGGADCTYPTSCTTGSM